MGKKNTVDSNDKEDEIFYSDDQSFESDSFELAPKRQQIQKTTPIYDGNKEVRRGRPHKRPSESYFDPTLKAKNLILCYLLKAGLPHGLILPQKCKNMFKDPSIYQNWERWSQKDEETKATKALNHYCNGRELSIKSDQMAFLFTKIADILPSCSTQQIYNLLAYIVSCSGKETDPSIIAGLFESFTFLNKSCIVRGVEYYNEMVSEEIIFGAFTKLVHDLCLEMKKVLNSQQKLNSFIERTVQEED